MLQALAPKLERIQIRNVHSGKFHLDPDMMRTLLNGRLISVGEVAKKAGVSYGTVRRSVSPFGPTPMLAPTIRKVLAALRIEPSEAIATGLVRRFAKPGGLETIDGPPA